MSPFHTQGAVPLDSLAYIEREFEQSIIKHVFNAKWVLVLGPHQHGKTTGLMRVNKYLKDSGCLSAFIDLQGLVNVCESYEGLLRKFCERIAKRLSIPFQEQPDNPNANQLIDWLEQLIPPGKQPVVIIIDEASAISNEEWRNIFYSQIRSIKNEQAMAEAEDLANRLRFVFSGCFRPETLVQTLNSPFNTCDEISTDDLRLDQAGELFHRVVSKADMQIIEASFDLVGGNPYLLQTVFDRVYLASENDKGLALDKAFEYLYSGQDNHFPFLFQKIYEDEKLKQLVSDMVANSEIPNDPADANSKFLRTLGIAKLEGKNLVFRNKLYKNLAENSPLFKWTEPHVSSGLQTVIENLIVGGVNDMKKIKIDASRSKIGENLIISDVIKDSFNKIESADMSNDLKNLLSKLGSAVEVMARSQDLTPEEAEEVLEDFSELADEAAKKVPRQKRYGVSIEGLQKAAAKLGEIGKPILELTAQILVILMQINK
jgi:hypothetical protein